MTFQSSRRRDPQPIGQGWELPALVIGGLLMALAIGALVGLGAACAVFGGGWVWPVGSNSITRVLGGLFAATPGRGLPPAKAALVPARGDVYGSIAVCELAVIALSITGAVLFFRYRVPNDARAGMAKRSEAVQVLGIDRLHEVKAQIRPDLYGKKPTARRAS